MCQPDCADKECGDNGCDGSCGTCDENDVCFEGACCTVDCAGKECGDDGCGGSCGACGQQELCEEGQCVCKSNCASFRCDINDGCGSICTCADDKWCSDGVCTDGNCVAIEVDQLGPGIAEIAGDKDIVFAASQHQLYAYSASSEQAEPWVARLTFEYKLDQIVTAKGYAFVVGSSTDTSALFHTVKFEEPGSLTIAGELALPKSISYAKGLEYADDHLFFLRYYQGLYSVSVESPTQPALTGNLDGFSPTYRDVDIHDGYAFVAAEDGLYVVDISSPSQMEVVGYSPTPHLTEVAVVGERAYVVSWDNYGQLFVVDVSDKNAPGVPEPISLEQVTSIGEMVGFSHYLVLEGYLEIEGETEPIEGVTIWDVSNPNEPVQASMIAESSLFSVDTTELRLFCTGEKGVAELDISSPTEPGFVADYPVLTTEAVHIHDHILYTLGSWSGNLFWFGFETSPRLKVKGVWHLEDEEHNYFLLTGRGDHLYVIGNDWDQTANSPVVSSRIGVLSVQGQQSPEWVGQLDLPGRVLGSALEGDYLVLAYQVHGESGQWNDIIGSGIYVVDLSAPNSPQLVGTWYGEPFRFRRIETAEDAAFVAWRSLQVSKKGMTVLDLSSPTSPNVVYEAFLGGSDPSRYALVAAGDYLIYGLEWVTQVFDISIPSEPLLLTTGDFECTSGAVALSHLYLAGDSWDPMVTIVETASLPNLTPAWQSFQEGPIEHANILVGTGHLFYKSGFTLKVFDVTGCWW